MRAAAALACLVLALWGCRGEPEATRYGAPADAAALRRAARPVSSLAKAIPAEPVVLSGEVGRICKMGCWFYLQDEREMLYVSLDLEGGFVIPTDSTGARAVVRGQIEGSGGDRELRARTVLLY